MRKLDSADIIEIVGRMCIDANIVLCSDIRDALEGSIAKEESETGRCILSDILENAAAARLDKIPICQDTGMAVFFVELGNEIIITGCSITDAINQGVRIGYQEGYLRKSVVGDPIKRINTGDNTPAVIYYDIVDGDKLRIDFIPKGFGSENMGAVKMLTPADGIEGIRRFVVDTVSNAGANPCPPIIVGVGIGGTMDMAAVLSKKALLRETGQNSCMPHIAKLEKELLEEINTLGIGPAGLGGRITALGVSILTYPTHIAGLPVAVSIHCNAARHISVVI